MENNPDLEFLRDEIEADGEDILKMIDTEVRQGFAEICPLRLHISNIPFSYGEDHLKKLLEQYGPVEDAEIISNHRGSKGFGFVTMKSQADAELATKALNGSMVNGRQIEVNLATPRKFTSKLSSSSSNRSVSSPGSASPISPGGPGFVFPRMMPSPVRTNLFPSQVPLFSPLTYMVASHSSTTPVTPGSAQTIQNIFIFPSK